MLLATCPACYVDLLRNLDPDNRALAELSIHYHPEAATSWFWLAEVRGRYQGYVLKKVNEDNWQEIAALLERGLSLAPHDGLRWRLLGDVLRPYAPEKAIQAYLQSCFNGDPGSNGCYRAGMLAEERGDYRNAIHYYRLSRWKDAQHRARELEAKVLLRERR